MHNPLELLRWLESNGYRLSVKKGNLYGPPGMPDDMAQAVKDHKSSILALMTRQCSVCNQPIRDAMNTENVLYIECVTDPVHFSLAMPRGTGPMFLSCGGIKPSLCVKCGAFNDGEWKYCGKCWLKFFEEDQANQASASSPED